MATSALHTEAQSVIDNVRKFLRRHRVKPQDGFEKQVADLQQYLARGRYPVHEQRFFALQMVRARHAAIVRRSKSLLATLEAEQFAALCLIDGAGCEHLEAARVCGCTIDAVRARARRARARIATA